MCRAGCVYYTYINGEYTRICISGWVFICNYSARPGQPSSQPPRSSPVPQFPSSDAWHRMAYMAYIKILKEFFGVFRETLGQAPFENPCGGKIMVCSSSFRPSAQQTLFVCRMVPSSHSSENRKTVAGGVVMMYFAGLAPHICNIFRLPEPLLYLIIIKIFARQKLELRWCGQY